MNCYLFDFDGTLVDSMPAFVSVMKRILDEHGIPYGPDLVKIITPLGYAGTARYFRQLGLDKPEDALIALMNEYALPEYVHRIPAKETVIGYKRICRFKEIRVRYFKLVIEKSRCFATISKFEAY